ncbi:hypothetical protein BKA70DRAFT_1233492 [Coprinopsis sp. MPI-PUGE-AT-0042]|nr:hypothetical protein BKA70DRAFT_1233492 [Coprinopsis sp. MPI-PUGE-AT-0042]
MSRGSAQEGEVSLPIEDRPLWMSIERGSTFDFPPTLRHSLTPDERNRQEKKKKKKKKKKTQLDPDSTVDGQPLDEAGQKRDEHGVKNWDAIEPRDLAIHRSYVKKAAGISSDKQRRETNNGETSQSMKQGIDDLKLDFTKLELLPLASHDIFVAGFFEAREFTADVSETQEVSEAFLLWTKQRNWPCGGGTAQRRTVRSQMWSLVIVNQDWNVGGRQQAVCGEMKPGCAGKGYEKEMERGYSISVKVFSENPGVRLRVGRFKRGLESRTKWQPEDGRERAVNRQNRERQA